MKISYYLRFSGNGFHFIIPYEQMTFQYVFNPYSDNENIYTFYGKIAKELREKYTELIDMKVYDSRRVCKVPYTLALYPDRIYVCKPINSTEEFENFTLEKATPQYIIRNQDFKKPQIFNPTKETYTAGIKLKKILGIK